MDKFEYKIRSEEINTLISEGRFAEAVEIADTIDWRRVKSVMMLCKISDLYKINRRYPESRDILLLAYEKHPTGRLIVYSLCELSIKMEEYVQAIEYYKEFVQIAPKDTGRYILQYRLYEAQDVSLEERIAVLEEFKKRDYREKWAYELAYLYHRIGLSTKCVEECDEMFLWFGEGKYVIKALELKALHTPLNADQQDKYDLWMQARETAGEPYEEEPEEEEHEEEPEDSRMSDTGRYPGQDGAADEEMSDILTTELPEVKTVDLGQYNTINLQMALAESMREILNEEEAAEEVPQEGSEEFFGEEYPTGEMSDAEYIERYGENNGYVEEFVGEEEPAVYEGEEEAPEYEDIEEYETYEGAEQEPGGYEYEDESVVYEDEEYETYEDVDEASEVYENGEEGFETYEDGEGAEVYEDEEEEYETYEDIDEASEVYEDGDEESEVYEDGEEAYETYEDIDEASEVYEDEDEAYETYEDADEASEVYEDGEEAYETYEDIDEASEVYEDEDEAYETYEDADEASEVYEDGEEAYETYEDIDEASEVYEDDETSGAYEDIDEEPETYEETDEELEAYEETGEEPEVYETAEEKSVTYEEPEEQPVVLKKKKPQPVTSGKTGERIVRQQRTNVDGAAEGKDPKALSDDAITKSLIAPLLEETIRLPDHREVERKLRETSVAQFPDRTAVKEPPKSRKPVMDTDHLQEISAQIVQEDTASFDAQQILEQMKQEAVKKAERKPSDENRIPGARTGVLTPLNTQPSKYDNILSQDYDGQISLVMPEAERIEKQITGQLSIEDIMAEWEEMKKSNEQKRMEDVRQRILQHTGNLFADFDEATKNGLLEELERAFVAAIMKESGKKPAVKKVVLSDSPGRKKPKHTEPEPEPEVTEQEETLEYEAEEAEELERVEEPVSEDIPEEVPEAAETGTAEKMPEAVSESEQQMDDSLGDRELTEEEKELFGEFIHHHKTERQIVRTLDNMSLAPYTGNVLITGEEDEETLTLAKALIREMQLNDDNFSGKVAKISGTVLNKKDVAETFGRLDNGALIIENASRLKPAATAKMIKALDKDNMGLLVLMLDKKQNINQLLAENTPLNSYFNLRIDIEALDDEALVAYAKMYAEEREYTIDEFGVLALHTRIADMQTSDHEVNTADVRELVDEAIYHANKKTPGHFMDILLAKRYNEDDMIILREKDFIHS